ncbi:hypothetical protein EV175_000139 [Coemansia sp. RSA 1933]|nr:hypothetical protein EV175_000139 [Coemansia sp. RSA 1933]
MADSENHGNNMSDSLVEQQLREFDNLVSDGAIVITDSSDNEYDGPVDLTSDTDDDEPDQGQFLDGTVRLTQILHEPRDTNRYYTFTDVVQPTKLRKALLTTFVLDDHWVRSHFDRSTRLVIVKSYRPGEERPGVVQSDDGQLTYVNTVFGKQKYPVMHSKTMLLFYDRYVRFVASSANLLEIDWTVLANILFIQDFPYTPNRIPVDSQQGLRFRCTLETALRDMDVPEQVVAQLKHIDMTRARAHLVTTVPSTRPRPRNRPDAAEQYGVQRLAQVVASLRGSTPQAAWFDTQMFCYGSSLGPLDRQYLASFHMYVLGGSTKYPDRVYRELGYPDEDAYVAHLLDRNIAVGFHTQDQTNGNRFGVVPKKCIMLSSDVYLDRNYPSFALHKVTPRVSDVLIHAKVIFARHSGSQGWMYLGSHNFTRGAWGSYQARRESGYYFNNYEFGVVLPDIQYIEKGPDGRTAVVWNGVEIPVPFDPYPWCRYSEMDMPSLNEM